MRKVFVSAFILFTVAASCQDSLFLSTDKPGSLWEDRDVTLAMKFTTANPGVIKALKFYKTDNRAGQYEIGLWDGANVKVAMVPVSTTATGWIRIPVNISIGAGNFIIGVYNPFGRYGFRNAVYPRTKGNLTATGGGFENGNEIPARASTPCYYLDLVFSKTSVPLSAKVTPDSAMVLHPWNPISIDATITGASSFFWSIVDTSGSWSVDTTNRLRPVLTPKTTGSIFLMLTATSPTGEQWSDTARIYSAPDLNKVIGYVLEGGQVIWRRMTIVF